MVLPTSANSVQAAIWVQLRPSPGPKPNQAAIWVQPVIAALVCLGRGDKGAAARALAACTSAERACIVATFAVKWRTLDMA